MSPEHSDNNHVFRSSTWEKLLTKQCILNGKSVLSVINYYDFPIMKTVNYHEVNQNLVYLANARSKG